MTALRKCDCEVRLSFVGNKKTKINMHEESIISKAQAITR
jgi:hypothetical protein